ncbi:reverse transcriptase zinc-binding domain-containing protein [Artemisia annua]|uniref:Reverse transcriptase zinc-binding domain-containing protein n=1 Tax=Artemisia annua TaxID=35608 RepID=A0A2U1LSI4_ARTAN|nr:reverse transcriptase zinc-binding domain-containing protein [Artemisia annua]
MYNARMKTDMVIAEVLRNGVWEWPCEWYKKYPIFNQVQTVTLSDSNDELMWKSKKGIRGKFSIKQAYNDLQTEEESVKWNKLVWYSQNILKHAFILWLAIQNKLVTQDKIKKWGSYDMMICSLCYEDMDSHQHLFFDCKYAKQFWFKVCLKMGVHWNEMEWDNIVNLFAAMKNGNTITSIIRRLCLAASVYLIWRERNCRVFKEETRSVEELFEVFSDTIRFRLASLKAKPTSAVIRAQDDWNVQMVTKTNITN